MHLAVGEWWHSNVYFSLVFLIALGGVTAVAAYVVRGDRINRRAIDNIDDQPDEDRAGH